MAAALAPILAALTVSPAFAGDTARPAKIDRADVAGAIFKRPNTVTIEKDGNRTLDNITLMTRDKKFETGMYRSGPTHFTYDAKTPYGVDEFMYFVKGSITLTSEDGTVQVIHAGEAVTIPSDWKGTWDTRGYTKFYAIYSATGNVD